LFSLAVGVKEGGISPWMTLPPVIGIFFVMRISPWSTLPQLLGVLFAMLDGVLGGAAQLAQGKAIQMEQVSRATVVGLGAMYPVVTQLISMFILREAWTWWQVFGLLLAGGATWCLIDPDTNNHHDS